MSEITAREWLVFESKPAMLRLGRWELFHVALSQFGRVKPTGSNRWDRVVTIHRWQFRRVKP